MTNNKNKDKNRNITLYNLNGFYTTLYKEARIEDIYKTINQDSEIFKKTKEIIHNKIKNMTLQQRIIFWMKSTEEWLNTNGLPRDNISNQSHYRARMFGDYETAYHIRTFT